MKEAWVAQKMNGEKGVTGRTSLDKKVLEAINNKEIEQDE